MLADDFVKYVPITGTLEEFIADAMTLRDPITGDSYRLIPLEHPTSPYGMDQILNIKFVLTVISTTFGRHSK